MIVLTELATTCYKLSMSFLWLTTGMEHLTHQMNLSHHLPHQFLNISWVPLQRSVKRFGKVENWISSVFRSTLTHLLSKSFFHLSFFLPTFSWKPFILLSSFLDSFFSKCLFLLNLPSLPSTDPSLGQAMRNQLRSVASNAMMPSCCSLTWMGS